jgi:uncharacterized protein
MGRLKKTRLIQMAPHFTGFRPLGLQTRCIKEDVVITFEEYEALNLCDFELLSHKEAAEMMKVSRPTLTRIYESVRRKIAKAFVEGCEIYFEEGNVNIPNWYECKSCGITFTITSKSGNRCPLCNIELNETN